MERVQCISKFLWATSCFSYPIATKYIKIYGGIMEQRKSCLHCSQENILLFESHFKPFNCWGWVVKGWSSTLKGSVALAFVSLGSKWLNISNPKFLAGEKRQYFPWTYLTFCELRILTKVFIRFCLCARHCSNYFTLVKSFKHHKSPIGFLLWLLSLYIWGNRDSGSLK